MVATAFCGRFGTVMTLSTFYRCDHNHLPGEQQPCQEINIYEFRRLTFPWEDKSRHILPSEKILPAAGQNLPGGRQKVQASLQFDHPNRRG
jgi:hypothetical protein